MKAFIVFGLSIIFFNNAALAGQCYEEDFLTDPFEDEWIEESGEWIWEDGKIIGLGESNPDHIGVTYAKNVRMYPPFSVEAEMAFTLDPTTEYGDSPYGSLTMVYYYDSATDTLGYISLEYDLRPEYNWSTICIVFGGGGSCMTLSEPLVPGEYYTVEAVVNRREGNFRDIDGYLNGIYMLNTTINARIGQSAQFGKTAGFWAQSPMNPQVVEKITRCQL